MANKTIELNRSATSGSYIIGKIVCDATADYSLNNSDVTCRLYVRKANDSTLLTIPTSGTWSYSMTINGKAFSGTVSKDVLLDWVLLATVSVSDIAHNDDGTKDISVSGSVTGPNSTNFSGHVTSGGGMFTLDTVPRASTIASAGNVTLGEKCNVKWVPASASFRYRLKFIFGSWGYITEAIHPNRKNLYTYDGYVVPLDAAYQIPNAYSGTMTVTLYTYSDAAATKQVGSADSEVFSILVPSSAKPSVTMNLSPVHSLGTEFDGLYIQGFSKVKATFEAEAYYNSIIRYYDMTVEGKTYGLDDSYTSEYLSGYGTIDVVGHAVDSRTYGGYTGKSINVIPYTSPKIQNVSVERCDADGNLMDSGTYLKISAKRSYSQVLADNVQKNFCCIRYRYKTRSALTWSEWVNILDDNDLSADEVTTEALLGTVLVTATYLVQVQAVDTIGLNSTVTFTVPTDSVFMHRSGPLNSIGLGKYAEKPNTLDMAWDISTDGDMTVAGNSVIGGTMSAAHIGSLGDYNSLDFNTLIQQTGYYVNESAPGTVGCSNYPVNVTGMLAVIAKSGSFAWQTYRTYDGDIYTRSYYKFSGWSAWKKVQFV